MTPNNLDLLRLAGKLQPLVETAGRNLAGEDAKYYFRTGIYAAAIALGYSPEDATALINYIKLVMDTRP